jgi:hypothetical protein
MTSEHFQNKKKERKKREGGGKEKWKEKSNCGNLYLPGALDMC